MIKKSEQEVMENWSSNSQPIVSICCTTYNHENYIAQAIDGFLMQETDFPFEIIIRDDFSTDKTAVIIRKYVKKYPNIIKPIFEKENQYSKGAKAMLVVIERAKGEYIALCEGDDYWTEPYKLQVQIDLLKKNPELVMSFHDVSVVNSLNEEVVKSKIDEYWGVLSPREKYSPRHLAKGVPLPTNSVVFRRVPLRFNEIYKVINVDTFLFALLGEFGGAQRVKGTLGAYRIHEGGIWSLVDEEERVLSRMYLFSRIVDEESFTRRHDSAEELCSCAVKGAITLASHGNLKSLPKCVKAYTHGLSVVLGAFIKGDASAKSMLHAITGPVRIPVKRGISYISARTTQD